MSTSLGANTIYLVRHGESMGNVKRLFLPADEDALSSNGQKQVELLGKHLSDVKFHRMYTSDYPRAVDTAEAIRTQSKFPEVQLEKDSRLRERSYGILEGQPYKEGFKQLQAANCPILDFEIPEGEQIADVVNRMGHFMQELFDILEENDEPENVLVVSHSFAIVTFLFYLSQSEDFKLINWDIEKDFKMLGNACYMKIEVELKIGLQMNPRTLNFICTNESSHLETLNESSGAFSTFTTSNADASKFQGCVQQ